MSAPSSATAPKTDVEAPEASVGVLGWLGFIIINGAAWGIITTSSWIAWPLGFGFCLVYTALIIGLAVWLDRRGRKYRQFVNLLWVIGLSFVFILGLYISVNIIGPAADGKSIFDDSSDSGGGGPPVLGDLRALLPDNASQELQAWASDTNWRRGATFAVFGGSVFFTGAARGDDSTDYLWRADGNSTAKVSPGLRGAESFAEFQSELYFSASSEDAGEELWRVGAGSSGAASLVGEVLAGPEGADVRNLFVDAASSRLYFKASFQCPRSGGQPYRRVDTIFSTDGTSAGTADLRGDPCAPTGGGGSGNSTSSEPDGGDEMPRGVVWGVLFVAALPMTVLAAVALAMKKLPGPSVNVLGGILAVAVCMYLLARETRDLSDFLKWFITAYTSVLWVAILAWSLLRPEQPEWLEELKTWAVAVVGVSFCVIIHVDLEIPFSQEAWRWVTYAALSLLQMVASAAVSRTVPMVAGCIGLFVISWKVAFEVVDFADFAGPQLNMLATLAIVAIQGIGIVVAAVFYAGRRAEIDALVRSSLTCRCKGGSQEASV